MAHSCFVHFVQALHELFGIEFHNRCRKSARALQVVEQVTVWSKFVGDAGHLLIVSLFYECFYWTCRNAFWYLSCVDQLVVVLLCSLSVCILKDFKCKVLSIL